MLRGALLLIGNGLMAGTLCLLVYGFFKIKVSPIFAMMGAAYVAAAFLSDQSVYLAVGASMFVASYATVFPSSMDTYLPLILLLPLALLTGLEFFLTRRKDTAKEGRALGYVAHLTAVGLLSTALVPRLGASVWAGLWAVFGGVLLYSYPALVKREGDYLFGFTVFVVVFCERVFTILGLPGIPILLSALLFPMLIAIFLVTPRDRLLAVWLNAALISVSLALSVYVSFAGDALVSSIVLGACALSYAIMAFLARREEYIYLLTLAVGLFVFDVVMSSADLFSWQLASIFMYIIIGIGFVILGLLFASVFRYRRPFSLLIAKNVTGAVLLSTPIIVFALVALGSYALRATENPLFCATCHNMKSQFRAWRNSAHSNVTCVACHRSGGPSGFVEEKMTGIVESVKYISGEYREKSHAQVADESCSSPDCHPKESITGRKMYKDGVHFDHEAHVEVAILGLNMRCSSCHSHISSDEHFSVNELVCFQCHLHERGEEGTAFGSCVTCHDVPEKMVGKGGIEFTHEDVLSTGPDVRCVYCHSDVTAGRGEVESKVCGLCHTESKTEDSGTSSIHQAHVTDFKVECIQCHEAVEHGGQVEHVASRELQSSMCSSCHTAKHDAAAVIYSGEAVKNAYGSPDPMYEAGVKCNGCHRYQSGKMVSGLSSCDHCHGEGSGYSDLVAGWQSDISEKAHAVEQLASDADDLLESTGEPNARVRKLIAFAKSAHSAVISDGSMGAHNYGYSSWLLDSASDSAQAAIAALRGGT